MMTGYGGTGKSGTAYRYYACKNAKKKLCQKKVVGKQSIEDRVVSECRKLLTDNNIEKIAAAVAAACEADYDSSAIRRIKSAIQEADAAIENLWKALEHGQAAEMITERIEKRQKERTSCKRSSPWKWEKRSLLPPRRSKPFWIPSNGAISMTRAPAGAWSISSSGLSISTTTE